VYFETIKARRLKEDSLTLAVSLDFKTITLLTNNSRYLKSFLSYSFGIKLEIRLWRH